MTNLQDKISDFWDWFVLNKSILEEIMQSESHSKTETIVQQIDHHILGMGKLKWEISNPRKDRFNLIISPNSNRELFQITQDIVEQSPYFEEWTFFNAIPAKGAFNIQLYDNNMDLQFVDAENWQVAIFPEGQNKVELIVLSENIDHLDEETQWVAVDLVITSILGEAKKIEKINTLEVTPVFDLKQEKASFTITELEERLQ